MKRRDRFLERVVFGADLPAEHLPGVPIVEIAGEHRVLIENHQGVTAYGCREICVKVRFGTVSVCGVDLDLARMSRHQLVITGKIDSVSICRGR